MSWRNGGKNLVDAVGRRHRQNRERKHKAAHSARLQFL